MVETRSGQLQNDTRNKRTNPIDASGNPLRCHVCQLIMHFARYCPHSTKNIGYTVTVFELGDVDNIEKAVLFTGGKVDALNVLAAESMNAAVLIVHAHQQLLEKIGSTIILTH